MKKYVAIILIIYVILTITLPAFAETTEKNVKAKVIKTNSVNEVAQENQPTKKVQEVVVRILEGEYENEEYEMQHIISNDITSLTSNIELKEKDNILVSIEEQEGEVTNINYIKKISQNYVLYSICIISILVLIIISRKRETIIYILSILVMCILLIISIQNGWNLILISSIVSLIITGIIFMSANKTNILDGFMMLLKTILSITISGLLMYALFDFMKLNNINIKISDNFINIKELLISMVILFSCGMYNAIKIAAQYIFYSNNRPYKTKSDNIIDGQRSLKL